MAKTFKLRLGSRDVELLQNIDRCPLTPEQMFQLAAAAEQPFPSLGDLRRRLRQLKRAGLINGWPYAIATTGRSPFYFKLTRDGFRFLHGTEAALPRRRHFEQLSPYHHHHTLSLSSLVVHLLVSAVRHGHTIEHYARENSVCLKADPFTIYPDGVFVLRRSDGRSFSFCIELDNGTERVRSKLDVECIERKLRGYDAHQSQFDAYDSNRYLVLLVTTRSRKRLDHMLMLASGIQRDPNRTVFLGANLQTLLQIDPFATAAFEDHRGLKRVLVPFAPAASKSGESVPQVRATGVQ
ncbi:MAG: replication-relaxation family protein [Fuerstiella sp.]